MANERARRFRSNPTKPEDAAWKILRTLRRDGIHVRRQHPIGRYIADFAVLKERLAIELDGGVHVLRAESDAERDRIFAQLDWRVVRIPNKLAFWPDQFLDIVRAAVRNEDPKIKQASDWLRDRQL
jgi:very-short-patch-repair endonuclease